MFLWMLVIARWGIVQFQFNLVVFYDLRFTYLLFTLIKKKKNLKYWEPCYTGCICCLNSFWIWLQATRGSRHYFNDWLSEHCLKCSQLFKSKFEAQSLACSVVNTSLFQQKVTGFFFFRFILHVCLYVCVCVCVCYWGGCAKVHTHIYPKR